MKLVFVDLPELAPLRRKYSDHPIGSRERAYSLVGIALRRHPELKYPCCVCGSKKAVPHHENYSLPLHVAFLCKPHHQQRHHELGWGQAKRIWEKRFVPKFGIVLKKHLEETLSCFSPRKTKTAEDIAFALHIERSAASNRLVDLFILKLLTRKRDGKLWRYSRTSPTN